MKVHVGFIVLFLIQHYRASPQLAFGTFPVRNCSGPPRVLYFHHDLGGCSSSGENTSASLFCSPSNDITLLKCSDTGCSKDCNEELADRIGDFCSDLMDGFGSIGDICVSEISAQEFLVTEESYSNSNCFGVQRQTTYYTSGCIAISPYSSFYFSCQPNATQLTKTKCEDGECSVNCTAEVMSLGECQQGTFWSCRSEEALETETTISGIIASLVIGWSLFGVALTAGIVVGAKLYLLRRRVNSKPKGGKLYVKLTGAE
jgi:hypothetical protein